MRFIFRLNVGQPLCFVFLIILSACGPSQKELTIGALKHFNRGNRLFESNNPKGAIAEYKMAIAMDDEQENFYYNLGLAYYTLVLYDLAIEAYRKAIEIKPGFPEAWYNLALTFDKIDETENAFMAYDKYQKLSRSNKTTAIKKAANRLETLKNQSSDKKATAKKN